MNLKITILLFFSFLNLLIFSQGTVDYIGGGPSLKKTEKYLDSIGIILLDISKLTKFNLEFTDSLNFQYKESIKLANELFLITKNTALLTSQLVNLIDSTTSISNKQFLLDLENNEVSEKIQKLTNQMNKLTWGLFILAFLQLLAFIYQLFLNKPNI